jgi:hypothetical protein
MSVGNIALAVSLRWGYPEIKSVSSAYSVSM